MIIITVRPSKCFRQHKLKFYVNNVDPRPIVSASFPKGHLACGKFANAEHHLRRTCYPVGPLTESQLLTSSKQSTLLPSLERPRRCLTAVLIPCSPLHTGQ